MRIGRRSSDRRHIVEQKQLDRQILRRLQRPIDEDERRVAALKEYE